jgi:hypothetical protein
MSKNGEMSMKKLPLILVLAILLAGGAIGAMSAPAHAQYGYNYPPPSANPYAQPWVGPNTPWTYYNGDWFLQGLLYNFFGPQYGWAPYYAYPPTYIVRPNNWYGPKWNTWYQRNPHYWQNFRRQYPYWAGHREGQRYDQSFYEMHHRGQGAGWQKGFRGAAPREQLQPGGRGPGPSQVAPPQGPRPVPAQQQQQWKQHQWQPQVQQQQKQQQLQQQRAPQPQQQQIPQQQIQRAPQPQQRQLQQQQQPQHQQPQHQQQKQQKQQHQQEQKQQ